MPTFTNQATLSYNGNVTNSNITTGELVAVLSATKTAVMNDYVARDDVTFILSIVNAGSADFDGLTITDSLGAYPFGSGTLVPLTYNEDSMHYYINGVLQPSAPTVLAGPPLVINGVNIPANSNAMLIYEARVNEFAPLGTDGSITNQAVMGGEKISALTASETIYTGQTANLTITKSMNPTVITENGEITYTFTIQNSGNTAASAADEVILTDTFNPLLTDLTATFNGAPWSQNVNYTYDEASGEFETIAGQITVPAATYTQDPINGNWIINPGVSVVTVTGNVQ